MKEAWHVLTKRQGGIGDSLPLLIEASIWNAKNAMEDKQEKFVEILAMAKGATGLLVVLAFDDGIPNPEEMAAAIRAYEVVDLN